jgi:hypothetical protein
MSEGSSISNSGVTIERALRRMQQGKVGLSFLGMLVVVKRTSPGIGARFMLDNDRAIRAGRCLRPRGAAS